MGGFNPQTDEFLELVTREHPQAVWQKAAGLIGPPTDSRAFHVLSWLRGDAGFREEGAKGAFALIPVKLVFEWIDKDPRPRAPHIARSAPNRLLYDDGDKSLFCALLERHGKDREVRGALHSNFQTEGWSGSTVNHYRRKLDAVRRLPSQEQNTQVRKWLSEEVEGLTTSIEYERIREERQ